MNELNTYKQVARYQQAAFNITFPYDFFLYLWCERSQFNANHCIYNIINLQISIIWQHFILVVYHTEFQFNFHPSSVVNVDISFIFYVYMTQQIALE